MRRAGAVRQPDRHIGCRAAVVQRHRDERRRTGVVGLGRLHRRPRPGGRRSRPGRLAPPPAGRRRPTPRAGGYPPSARSTAGGRAPRGRGRTRTFRAPQACSPGARAGALAPGGAPDRRGTASIRSPVGAEEGDRRRGHGVHAAGADRRWARRRGRRGRCGRGRGGRGDPVGRRGGELRSRLRGGRRDLPGGGRRSGPRRSLANVATAGDTRRRRGERRPPRASRGAVAGARAGRRRRRLPAVDPGVGRAPTRRRRPGARGRRRQRHRRAGSASGDGDRDRDRRTRRHGRGGGIRRRGRVRRRRGRPRRSRLGARRADAARPVRPVVRRAGARRGHASATARPAARRQGAVRPGRRFRDRVADRRVGGAEDRDRPARPGGLPPADRLPRRHGGAVRARRSRRAHARGEAPRRTSTRGAWSPSITPTCASRARSTACSRPGCARRSSCSWP